MYQKSIETEKILITSPYYGSGHIDLHVAPQGPQIEVVDGNGRKRMTLTVGEEGPMISLWGRDDHAEMRLTMDGDESRVELCDSAGKAFVLFPPPDVADYAQWQRIWRRLVDADNAEQSPPPAPQEGTG